MWDDPIHAVPGTRRRRAEVEARRREVARRADRSPDEAWSQGTLAAARWTLRETPEPPLSASRAPDRPGVEAELAVARSVALGITPGDRERAAGVREWLEWWL